MIEQIEQINFDKKIFNDSFFPLLYDNARILALKGSGGSGKSEFIASKWLFRHLNETNLRTVLVRKVHNKIRNSQYKLLGDIVSRWKVNHLFQFRESDMTIKCLRTGSEFLASGMDNEEKIKSMAQPTGIWTEEVTELSEKEFLQLMTRMRGILPEGVLYPQITPTFNPIEDGHWIHAAMFPPQIDQALYDKEEKRNKARIKNKWYDFNFEDVACRMERHIKLIDGTTVPVTYTLHHSTYQDNRFLTEEDKAVYEDFKNKDLVHYMVYAKGRWGTLSNLVFEKPWRILDEFPEHYDEVIYGIDFGYHHPTVVMQIGYLDDEIYAKELFYEKKKTRAEVIELIKDLELIEPGGLIYADSAEPATIEDFSNEGFYIIGADKGNYSIKAGIDYLKSRIIYSHVDNVNLNRELRSYKHKEDANSNPMDGSYVPRNDDCISAVRYPVYTHSRGVEVKAAFI